MVKFTTSAFIATVAVIAAAAPATSSIDPTAASTVPSSDHNGPTPTAGGGTSPIESAAIKALQQALLSAPGSVDRQAVLLPNPPDASNITYQYHNNTVKPRTGGTIALATLENFPAFLTVNLAFAIGFVNPCGMNVPHNHPRASEFLVVIQGKLIGGLILETNQENSEKSWGMLFPQGETHFQFNPTCEPALFAAGFDSNDPGRTQVARNFFSAYPDDVLISAVGGDLETLDPARIARFREQIPTAFAEQIESCVKRCNIAQK